MIIHEIKAFNLAQNTSRSNVKYPNFKGNFELNISKSALDSATKNTGNEVEADEYFRNALKQAINEIQDETTASTNDYKIIQLHNKRLNTTEHPLAIEFFNYPGYKSIQAHIQEHGSKDRFEEYLKDRFELDWKLPETNEKKYKFIVSTNNEKDLYLQKEPTIYKNVLNFIFTMSENMKNKLPKLNESEIYLLSDLGSFQSQQKIFHSIANKLITIDLSGVESLPKVLKIILKLQS